MGAPNAAGMGLAVIFTVDGTAAMVNERMTLVAGVCSVSPAFLAVMVHDPVEARVTVFPATVQLPAPAKLIVNPELMVAVSVKGGVPYTRSGSVPKRMICC